MAAYEPSSHPQPLEEARALHHLSGDTNWSYNPDTGLLWDVPNFVKTPPTQEEVDAEIARLVALDAAEKYKYDRMTEYPRIRECVHALLDGGDTLTDLQATRTAVKNKYPKP